MEQRTSELENKQVRVDALMNWLGWNNSPQAKDFKYKDEADMQSPIRSADKLRQEVESAKRRLEKGDINYLRVELPKITIKGEENGLTIISGGKRTVFKSGTKVVPSTRELFQRIAEVLVTDFDFGVPDIREQYEIYPTNDPQVSINLGGLENRFKGQPLDGVFLEVSKAS